MGIVRKSELQAFAVDFLANKVLAVFAVGAWDEDAKEWVGQPHSDTQTFNYAALSKEDAKKYNDVLGAVTAKALADRDRALGCEAAALNALDLQRQSAEACKKERDEAVAASTRLNDSRWNAVKRVDLLESEVNFYKAAYKRVDTLLTKARSLKSRLTFGLWT